MLTSYASSCVSMIKTSISSIISKFQPAQLLGVGNRQFSTTIQRRQFSVHDGTLAEAYALLHEKLHAKEGAIPSWQKANYGFYIESRAREVRHHAGKRVSSNLGSKENQA